VGKKKGKMISPRFKKLHGMNHYESQWWKHRLLYHQCFSTRDHEFISRELNGTNISIDGALLVNFTDDEFTLSIEFFRFVNIFEDEITDDACKHHKTNTGTYGEEMFRTSIGQTIALLPIATNRLTT
jgi:hypothetical protein